MAPNALGRAGNGLPSRIASTSENRPATRPLTVTMVKGSFAEIFLVKLLSNPQNIHAAIIPTVPGDTPHFPFRFVESIMPAVVIKAIAHHAGRLRASLNNRTAISAVATPSKFKSKEAVAAGVLCRLKSNTIGAAMPPARIDPASHGKSPACNCASALPCLFPNRRTPRTTRQLTPLPK